MDQSQYNLFHRIKIEHEFAPLYPKRGLGLTTFSPLSFGILSGKYNHEIPADSRLGDNASRDPFTASLREKIGTDVGMENQLEASRKLGAIAKELGITQSQLALAWILLNGNISSIITGATRPEQVVENVGALKAKELITPEIRKRIEEAVVGALDTTPDQVMLTTKRFGMPPESL